MSLENCGWNVVCRLTCRKGVEKMLSHDWFEVALSDSYANPSGQTPFSACMVGISVTSNTSGNWVVWPVEPPAIFEEPEPAVPEPKYRRYIKRADTK